MKADELTFETGVEPQVNVSVRRPDRTLIGKVGSVLAVAVGLPMMVVGFVSADFRDGEGALTGRFVLPVAAGIASILFGLAFRTKWRAFTSWFAVALIGQAAALQLIDAGRLIHFQHYRSLQEVLHLEPIAFGLFVFQTGLVFYFVLGRIAPIVRSLRGLLRLWQLAAACLFLFLAGAAVTPDALLYVSSLLAGAWIQIVNLATVVLLAWSVPDDSIALVGAKVSKMLGTWDSRKGVEKVRVDRFALLAALWIVVVTGSLSYFVYQNHPHVPDEAQYLFQARYMAAGQLTAKAPLVPEAFSMYMIPYRSDRWFGIFSPGWPAILAVGSFVDAEWLVNPLIAGICVVLAYIFFHQQYSQRFARIGIILLCCSPWFIFMGMSLMAHMVTLAAALGAVILLKSAVFSRRYARCILAGMLIGIISLIRPLDGAIVAVLLGIWMLIESSSIKRGVFSSIALVAGTLATAAIVFPYNWAVTGNAFLMPFDKYYSEYFWPNVMALGFGPERGMGWGLDAFPGHSPLEAIINTALNASLLQTELFGWGVGSLTIIVFLVVSGSVQKRDLWALIGIAGIVISYSLFWYHGGPDFGARYWFLAIIPLIALTVSGIEWMGSNKVLSTVKSRSLAPRISIAVGSLCIISAICYIPWRAANKYYHYLGMEPGIRQLSRKFQFGNGLVLIRGAAYPDYQSAWTFNPLNFEGDAAIYAFDRSPEVRSSLLRAYRGRSVWIVDGPGITGKSFQVVAGPLQGGQLLEDIKGTDPEKSN